MIILGIDPGTAALGYGLVERNGHLREVDHGCLVTTPDQALPERLAAIYDVVTELIELHTPDLVAQMQARLDALVYFTGLACR